MKRNLFVTIILFFAIITLAGCGSSTKTMTCTKESNDNGYKAKDTMVITYNSEKVLKVETENLEEVEPDLLDYQLQLSNLFVQELSELDGIEIRYEKVSDNQVKMVSTIEYDKINPDQMKEKLGSLFGEDNTSLYKSKDISIEDFKEKYLDGFTCK